MCPDVVVECCSTSKGPAAVATLERPVTGVRNDVVPQLRWLRERLGAVAALVGPAMGKRNTMPSVSSVIPSQKWRGQEHLVFPGISKESCGDSLLGPSWKTHTQIILTSLANVKYLCRNHLRVCGHGDPPNRIQQTSELALRQMFSLFSQISVVWLTENSSYKAVKRLRKFSDYWCPL